MKAFDPDQSKASFNVTAKHKSKLKTVELVKSGYQPTKAEIEEEFTLRKPDGSPPSVEDIAQAVRKSMPERQPCGCCPGSPPG